MDTTILVIIIYFIVMILLGIFAKKAKGSKEFCVAKCTLTTAAVTVGLVMTHYGGGFILGGAELGYKYGLFGLVYGVSTALGVLVLGLLFSKKIYQESKKNKIKTIPSFLFSKFKDRKIALISSLLSIIALTAIASAQLFAATRIFSALNIPIRLSVVLITIIVALIATKGMKALTKSGKYNLIIASMGAIAAILIASNIIPVKQSTQVEIMPFGYLLGILLPTVLYTMIGQDFHQKLYSAESEKTAKRACIISFSVLFLLSFFPVVVGMKSASLFTIQPSEAIPKFIIFTMPSILKGLFIAAILAAVIGSSQSVINAASTQVSEDIFKPLKKFSNKSLGKISEISALALPVFALVITLFSTSIIKNIIIAYTLYTAGMFVPTISAFYLKNPKKLSKPMFSALVLSLVSVFIFEYKIIDLKIPSIIPSIVISVLFLTPFVSIKLLKN